MPPPFTSARATLRAEGPPLTRMPRRGEPPSPSPRRATRCPLRGAAGEPEQAPQATTLSSLPSLFKSPTTGRPAIGPTSIEAVLAGTKRGFTGSLGRPVRLKTNRQSIVYLRVTDALTREA